jgi:hypothetical protein
MWIAFYRLRRRKQILETLARSATQGVRTVILDSDAAVDAFTATLPARSPASHEVQTSR